MCGPAPTSRALVTVYDAAEHVERIHGHGGATALVWIDTHDQAPRTGGPPAQD